MSDHDASAIVNQPIPLSVSTLIPLGSTSADRLSRLWPRFTWNARRESPTVVLRVTHFPQDNRLV